MTKRKITIETRGPIRFKSGIVGPLTTPYLEDESLIARMIIGGIKVVEHKEDGTTVLLSTKHLKELTANNTKVIKENRLQASERTALQELARVEQERVLAENKGILDQAKASLEPPIELEVTPVTQVQMLSKKERKELARAEARSAEANSQQEEIIETK